LSSLPARTVFQHPQGTVRSLFGFAHPLAPFETLGLLGTGAVDVYVHQGARTGRRSARRLSSSRTHRRNRWSVRLAKWPAPTIPSDLQIQAGCHGQVSQHPNNDCRRTPRASRNSCRVPPGSVHRRGAGPSRGSKAGPGVEGEAEKVAVAHRPEGLRQFTLVLPRVVRRHGSVVIQPDDLAQRAVKSWAGVSFWRSPELMNSLPSGPNAMR
jgi:hypothetical protein